MYFEIEDSRPDVGRLGGPITWRDGLFLSIIAHLLFVIVILLGPKYFPFLSRAEEARVVPPPQPRERTQFVFVQPRVDLQALKPPENAPPSDIDRQAQSRERAVRPENRQPVLRGNTRERVEQSLAERARGRGPQPTPQPETPPQPEPPPQLAENRPPLPDATNGLQVPNNRANTPAPPPRPLGGSLGDSLRNLDRYVQRSQFDNVQGNGAFGPAIQFDTKGVEFGPWIRRFIAQVKRNWEPLIPLSAMTQSGHVVVTFNVHKNGSITDLSVTGPSPIGAFNTAAYGALASSNPTAALPPEYPADKAFFTVTFFYNEEPPQ